uniref:TonB-dependent receptor plug domain-containing protein n=1 Tax=Flavobacterium sp. TaxID=239 RepID=UPI00404A77C8
MNQLTCIFFWLCCILCVENVHAQTVTDSLKTTHLDEVVITGTRTARNAANLPMPIQIIDAKTIQNSGVSRLNEILQEQTGLVTVTDFGGGEGIQMQGLDAAYTLLLIDGQPLMGRTAGTLDLSRISVLNIDRIEIIKGASSSLYGSEALAGVINIITKTPKFDNQLKVNSNYKFASFNTHDVSSSFRYGKNKLAVELFSNYFKTNGYDLNPSDNQQTVEAFQNGTLQTNFKYNISNTFDIKFNSRFFAQNQDYTTTIDAQNLQGESEINDWNQTILTEHKVNNSFRWLFDGYVTQYKANEFLNDANGLLFESSDFNQWFFRPEFRAHYKQGQNTLTTGFGANHERLERTFFDREATLESLYFYSQFEWFLHEKWNVLAGFRYDHHQQFTSQLSPKLGINYELSKKVTLKSSVGYGYKAPDLRQLYFDFTNSSVGYAVLGYNVAEEKLAELEAQNQILFSNQYDFSEPLKPESSINVNLGGHFKYEKLKIETNLFYNRINNLIDTKAIAQKTNGQNVFSYFNLNEIFTYGLELNTNYQLFENYSISAGYQYLIAKDQEVVEQINAGEIFARDPNTLASFQLQKNDYFGLFNRSKHTANLKMLYEIPKFKSNVNLRIFYRSKFGLFDTNNNNILDRYDTFVSDYWTVNLSINKEFKHGFSLQIGAQNLFDYQDIDNIPSLPGRQFFTRIQFNN